MSEPHPELVAERDRKLAALGPKPRWWRPLARRQWSKASAAINAVDVSQMAWLLRQAYPADAIVEMTAQRTSFGGLLLRGLTAQQRFVEVIEYDPHVCTRCMRPAGDSCASGACAERSAP